MYNRLPPDFFRRDAIVVAPELLGKALVRQYPNDFVDRYIITEVEAYCGVEDLACHASKGRTKRTEIMYANGGVLYMYFIYGLYWMLNIVTSVEDNPQAVLIRGIDAVSGPGRVTKLLRLDKSFYGEDLSTSERIWVEKGIDVNQGDITTTARIGVDYAGEWKNKPLRFVLNE